MSDSPQPANDAEPPALATTAGAKPPLPFLPPDYAEDPEIHALLDFEPCPRKRNVAGAWTPELQREFIARLAVTGSPGRASEEMGKTDTGVRKVYRSPEGLSFRAAWDAAIALAKRRAAGRAAMAEAVVPGSRPPSLDNRRRAAPARPPAEAAARDGKVLNEHGEWEDEASYHRRADEARDSISTKLQRARRLFLHDISGCPAKRAAFEILTELPVDWAVAAKCRPQADEPWRKPRARDPDLLLAAENGWLGEFTHGPDKKAELLREVNAWRADQGLEPVGWMDE